MYVEAEPGSNPGALIPGEGDMPKSVDALHNQYCKDDWEMYRGDGPRAMGPNNDGCVCELLE